MQKCNKAIELTKAQLPFTINTYKKLKRISAISTNTNTFAPLKNAPVVQLDRISDFGSEG